MKTRFRRFVEFTFLIAIYCCSSVFCYEAGLQQAKPTTPVATPPVATPGEDPQATEVQPKAAEAPIVAPEPQPIKITPRTTSHQLTIRGQPLLGQHDPDPPDTALRSGAALPQTGRKPASASVRPGA